ncbi:DUF3530 family protein [Salinimonas sp. HHU 13199]|uniref:DUF3530 family protein n=1 Tax=Salinimonas profundi TaxID=2729140 RepID=A0ABR8LPK8_9ALTE|nr:DUF3530 family protein [Salinimonas profundi]MBD3586039.1 DUF3530 family protein [Salinimonas profundi]
MSTRTLRITLLTLLLTLFSVNSAASLLSEALTARYNEQERISFLAGDEEHVALSFPPTITLKRGVAIVLAEAGYQGLTLQSGSALAQPLRRWGWHVVVVPVVLEPQTESAAEPAASTAYTDDTGRWLHADTFQSNLSLITSGIFNQFADEPGYKIVVSQGMTAAQLLNLNAQEKVSAPDAIVVIAPFWPEMSQNQQVANWIADTTVPVLDIAGGLANHWSAKTMLQRNNHAQAGLKMHYRQRQLSESAAGTSGIHGHTSPFITRLSKEIYGWTRYLGW